MPVEMAGFLGTGAPWRADAEVVVEIAMGLAWAPGLSWSAAGGSPHKYCQSAVVVLNLMLVPLVMSRPFHESVRPDLPAGLRSPYYAVATAHAGLGPLALLLALSVALTAGTPRYRPWMRATLALWWLALGIATYVIWYGPPLTRLLAVGHP